MTPYFRSGTRRRRLVDVALSWRGTPFVGNQAIKGAGVDCIRLADAVLREAGWNHAAPFPEYRVQQGLHKSDPRLKQHFVDSPEFQEVTLEEMLPGDVLLFGVSRDPYHTGVCLRGLQFIHCMRAPKVNIGQMDDPTFKRVFNSIFRPLEPIV